MPTSMVHYYQHDFTSSCPSKNYRITPLTYMLYFPDTLILLTVFQLLECIIIYSDINFV